MQTLPERGRLLIKNCGQGEWALLTALVKKDLQVYAYDEDSDNVDTAQNCVATPSNLHYMNALDDETGYDHILDLKTVAR